MRPVAIVVGTIAWITLWVALCITPWVMRASVASGNLGDVYAIPLVLWGAVVTLHVAAFALGIVIVRGRTRIMWGIVSATIGATGLLGLAIYFTATYFVLPFAL